MPGHDCSGIVPRQKQAKEKDPPLVKKVWVQKKSPIGAPTTRATPLVALVHQAMPMSHSGVDVGWRVATKKTSNKGVLVSTGNHLSTLDEETSVEGDVDAIEVIPEEENEPLHVQ